MNKVFTKNGWDDYIYWQTEKRKTLKKINKLIDDICRNGNSGIGKPEPLIGDLSGFWSRRINVQDRFVYKIDEQNVYILSCRYHYSESFPLFVPHHYVSFSHFLSFCHFSIFYSKDFLKKTGGNTTPLLLLDDIFDKLDAFRVEQIVNW